MIELANNKYPPLIAICGGIGSGKSVVSEILRAIGYKVYDCDSEAKRIMDSNYLIRIGIKNHISPSAININGEIDRKRLSEVVFKDQQKLLTLNRIVHPFVVDDILIWARKHQDERLLFVETALPQESGIDKIADGIVEVSAPEETRIIRVMKRNKLSKEEVKSRIKSQHAELDARRETQFNPIIINDDRMAILPQLKSILDGFQSVLHT